MSLLFYVILFYLFICYLMFFGCFCLFFVCLCYFFGGGGGRGSYPDFYLIAIKQTNITESDV